MTEQGHHSLEMESITESFKQLMESIESFHSSKRISPIQESELSGMENAEVQSKIKKSIDEMTITQSNYEEIKSKIEE